MSLRPTSSWTVPLHSCQGVPLRARGTTSRPLAPPGAEYVRDPGRARLNESRARCGPSADRRQWRPDLPTRWLARARQRTGVRRHRREEPGGILDQGETSLAEHPRDLRRGRGQPAYLAHARVEGCGQLPFRVPGQRVDPLPHTSSSVRWVGPPAYGVLSGVRPTQGEPVGRRSDDHHVRLEGSCRGQRDVDKGHVVASALETAGDRFRNPCGVAEHGLVDQECPGPWCAHRRHTPFGTTTTRPSTPPDRSFSRERRTAW